MRWQQQFGDDQVLLSYRLAVWLGRYLALLACSLCLHSAWAQPHSAERRVALVIGNSAYKTSPLKNPQNDARDMAAALRKLGFEVIERQNVGREALSLATREFGDKLKGASVGLFYFAGHGLQVKGKNYLVPIDSDIAREDEVPYRSFDVNEVLDKMDSARTAVNVVVLDACRNNPFARSFRPAAAGLAQMDAPTGSMISFATAPGSVAQDGEGNNGLYTGALLRHIATPGLAVEQMFKRVRVDVVQASNNQQVPWESSSLNRDFVFASASSTAAPNAAQAAATGATELAVDLAFWDAVKDSKSSADYKAYLEQFPSGRFAALARVRMQNVETQSMPLNAASSLQSTSPLLRVMSPEGLYAAVLEDGLIYWQDATTLQALRNSKAYDLRTERVRAALFSPDGRWLIVTLDLADGKRVQQLHSVHTGKIEWRKFAANAQFNTSSPTVRMHNQIGELEEVLLP
jgi:uncharacterized caspase-like protein